MGGHNFFNFYVKAFYFVAVDGGENLCRTKDDLIWRCSGQGLGVAAFCEYIFVGEYAENTGSGIFFNGAQGEIAHKAPNFFSRIAAGSFFDALNLCGHQFSFENVDFTLCFVVGDHMSQRAVFHGFRVHEGERSHAASIVAD